MRRIIAALLFVAGAASGDPAPALWSYTARGNLDEATLRCAGQARVSITTDATGRRCLRWQLVEPRCTGSSDVDGLHEGDSGREVCDAGDGWQLVGGLPGLGACAVQVSSPEVLAALRISCTWRCRGGEHACSGSAEYAFIRAAPRPVPAGSHAGPVGNAGAPAETVDTEVTRLLDAAAGHSTRSAQCYDGHGNLAKVESVVVSATMEGSGLRAIVAYTAVNSAVGDSRVCGRRGNCESAFPTTKTSHHITLEFTKTADGAYLLQTPAAIPGFKLVTPLDKPHDGDCAGKRPAWRPSPIRRSALVPDQVSAPDGGRAP